MKPFVRPLLPSLSAVCAIGLLLAGCAGTPSRPAAWQAPQALVAPSSFTGVHGLAVDKQGRLLAGSVVGNAIWQVDRQSGAARILIGGPEGQADDIAIGPNGEMAWTNYLMGAVRVRDSDSGAQRVVAQGLPGLNSLDFDRRNGKLYATQVFLGDALYELDPKGVQPPRLITKDLGGFNGFEVGPDGMLYGPLWFKRSVAKVDPANGAVSVINADFEIPAAANLDGKGNLWVVDTATGELSKVALDTGRKTVVAKLPTALDNLAIAPDDGTIYVSNMADNAVIAVNPSTGATRTLTRGAVAVPAGLRAEAGQLWVADIFAFRRVDTGSGAVTDLKRMQSSDMEYPFSIGLSAKHVALASWFTGSVQVLDRDTLSTQMMLHGWQAPYDALPLADGSVLVAELATGSLVRAHGDNWQTRTPLATGLAGPVQMALGPDGASVYVSEAAGNIVKVGLADGSKTQVATGLALPEGLAFTPWGTLVVAETAAGRLTELDLANNQRRTVAERLPIGLSGGPGMPPPYVPTGVAVDAAGTVYFSADRNNAVYAIKPQR